MTPAEVLDFWIGEIGEEGWYKGSPEIDDEIRDRFGDLWQAAADGGLEHWVEGPAGSLAYLIVTDQFSRNIWRGDAKAFSTDAQACKAARRAIEAGWDLDVPEPVRQFFYLPFMHSEDLADQSYCVELIGERLPETGADNHLHARAHEEVIRRFGRFPYRNAAFGRSDSAEETQFLQGGGYAAIADELRQKP